MTFSLTLRATDVDGDTNTSSFVLTVVQDTDTPAALALPAVSDINVAVGDNVSIQLPLATGGETPITYSIAMGTLPVGLLFSASTRRITGIPTTVETQSLTYRATDSGNATVDDDFSIAVSATPVDSVPVLPDIANANAFVGTAFSLQLPDAVGGDAPIGYLLTGNLPGGLSYSTTDKQITGTPTTAQTRSLTWTATDSDNDFDAVDFDIQVTDPVADSTPSIPSIAGRSIVINVALNWQLPAAVGGNPPLTYSLTGAALPTGLSFDADDRRISGTPTATQGDDTITLNVSDNDNDTDTEDFSFEW